MHPAALGVSKWMHHLGVGPYMGVVLAITSARAAATWQPASQVLASGKQRWLVC